MQFLWETAGIQPALQRVCVHQALQLSSVPCTWQLHSLLTQYKLWGIFLYESNCKEEDTPLPWREREREKICAFLLSSDKFFLSLHFLFTCERLSPKASKPENNKGALIAAAALVEVPGTGCCRLWAWCCGCCCSCGRWWCPYDNTVVESGRSIIIIINIGAVNACDDCKFCSEHETREIQISEWNLHSFLPSTSLVRRKLSAFWENTRQDFLPLVRSSVYLFSEKVIVVEGKSGVHGCQFHGQKLHKRLETTRVISLDRSIQQRVLFKKYCYRRSIIF